MMEIWLSAAGEYGFPIVITFYLLYRIEKKLDNLNQSVLQLQQVCPVRSVKKKSQVKGKPSNSRQTLDIVVEEHS
ncbi:YvrJ family protein [Salipaludibacillus sp. CUR1]|uniref:YvrJ family protein n=1 Tax=Salipaludibacillus sp. CUR1 TaxID=2820003 RepID=UPI001E35DA97|nr:YvrJ family protein [Salipaludibacillus sp. CUR1]MCE7793542.1 YvrJ family protein [Salipaludibacillus sp. CUR1]